VPAMHSFPSRARGDRRGLAETALRLMLVCALSLFAFNPAPPPKKTIVAFGDSLTAGYGLPPAQAFPVVLHRRLRADGYDATVLNAGVIGDTTQKGLFRLQSVEALNPDLVILELGGNDMLNGVDPRFTKANLEKIILRLRAKGSRVLLAGMRATEAPLDEAKRRRFDKLFPSLATQHSLPFVPNILEGVSGDPKLVLWGGIHPNREGVRRIVDRVAPLVENTLEQITGRSERAGRRA
jgi:acyl-CoA thioesterase I